jgi:Nuclease-related domain
MKIIENTSQSQKSQPANVLGGMIGSLKLGRSTPQEIQAQQAVISMLEKALDNRYFLLRNVSLAEQEAPIPMILVGPPGVIAILPVALRGVYRAKVDEWVQLDTQRQSYKPATPNLIIQTEQMAQAVEEHLKAQNIHPPSVEPVLVFTDTGIHIEMARPVVRIVLIDAIDRFIAGLLQAPAFLPKEEVQQITDCLAKVLGIEERSLYPERDAFSFSDESTPRSKGPTIVDRLPRGERAVTTLNKIPLSNRQWLVLGCLMAINILILIAVVVFILFSS